jgi:hypothetical protein
MPRSIRCGERDSQPHLVEHIADGSSQVGRTERLIQQCLRAQLAAGEFRRGRKLSPLFWFTTSEFFTKLLDIDEGQPAKRTSKIRLWLADPTIVTRPIWFTPVDDEPKASCTINRTRPHVPQV